MAESVTVDTLDITLDALGQQPVKVYTQIAFCFAVDNVSVYPTIVDTLTKGLERVSANFPWLSGQLVSESGIYKIKPLEKTPRLVVKDLRGRDSKLTWDALRRADFPISLLDESDVAPRKTIAVLPGESSTEEIFLLQATLIEGGLILTLLGQHQAMDGVGQGQVIELFSKACRNDIFTPQELEIGNLPDWNRIPQLDDSYDLESLLSNQLVKPAPPPNPQAPSSPPPSSTWDYFVFSADSLTQLKALAIKTCPSGFVSTDDTVSAFIWQSVTRARLHRLPPSQRSSTIARAVDARRYLGVSPTHPGYAQNMAYNTIAVQELANGPLGVVASALRSQVDPKTSDLSLRTRALATYITYAADKESVSLTATLDTSVDIALSSWVNQSSSNLDFGLGLGKPAAVRRPRFTPVGSLMYLLPKALNGDVGLAIWLRDEDLERLRADEEFLKYATRVG
ncbi:hypothetical protein ACO1O0_000173 [Amphichorda felina]